MMAVGYWCLPCAEDGVRLRAAIRALAKLCARPAFAPHLSLGTLEAAAPDVSDVAEALKGLVLEPAGLAATDVFTKAAFVRFSASAQLVTARTLLEAKPGFLARRAFDPHVSLVYGVAPERWTGLAQVRRLLARPVRFDRLAATALDLPVDGYDKVQAWTQLDSWAL